jgi:hypothetical protein
MVPILSQILQVYILPTYPFQIYSNIILSSKPRSSKWPLLFRTFGQNCISISHLSLACYMPRPSHSWFHHSNNIWWSVQLMRILIMQASLAFRKFLSLRSKYSPQRPVLKHLNPCYSVRMRYQFLFMDFLSPSAWQDCLFLSPFPLTLRSHLLISVYSKNLQKLTEFL